MYEKNPHTCTPTLKRKPEHPPQAFLRNQNIPMAIVSQNGNFLDQICAKTLDAEGGLCTDPRALFHIFTAEEGECSHTRDVIFVSLEEA